MKIGIYGSYKHNNFGDDLQALLFAQHIKNQGHQPCVFQLPQIISDTYQIPRAETIAQMLEGAAFCIIGGGGFLIPEYFEYIEEELNQIRSYCEQNSIDVYALSIGGGGQGKGTPLPYGKARLFGSKVFKGATLRLASDMPLMQAYQVPATYIPDVLWLSDRFWPMEAPNHKSNKSTIGFQLLSTPAFKQTVRLATTVPPFANTNTHYTSFQLHNDASVGINELQIQHKRFTHHQNTDPLLTIKAISELDLLIASKMHIALVGLCYGVPFISMGAQHKTRTLLKEINATFATIPSGRKGLLKAIKKAQSPSAIAKYKQQFDFELISQEKQKAMQHLDYLNNLLTQYS